MPSRKPRELPVPSEETARTANRQQFTLTGQKLKPPFWGVTAADIDSGDLFKLLSHKVLFEARWGYKKGGLSDEEYRQVINTKAKPMLNSLIDRIQSEKLLKAHAAYGYFRCSSSQNTVKILDEDGLTLSSVEFPRQRRSPYLSLADFISENDNLIGVWSVTLGSSLLEEGKKLMEQGSFLDYHLLNGLGAELADCGAVWIHRNMHRELFPNSLLTDNKPEGCRYSFGYPSCPDLSGQKEIFRLLGGQTVTHIKLTESYMMEPELSVSGFILFNKGARYFVV